MLKKGVVLSWVILLVFLLVGQVAAAQKMEIFEAHFDRPNETLYIIGKNFVKSPGVFLAQDELQVVSATGHRIVAMLQQPDPGTYTLTVSKRSRTSGKRAEIDVTIGDDRITTIQNTANIGDAIVAALELEFGVGIDLAPDGATALTLTSNYSYDLVVLDWSVPPPTGLELLKYWRRTSMVGRVIMLTAWSETEVRESALSHGADDFLTKPFCIDELRVRARRLLPEALNG